jgi:hypothetical protein
MNLLEYILLRYCSDFTLWLKFIIIIFPTFFSWVEFSHLFLLVDDMFVIVQTYNTLTSKVEIISKPQVHYLYAFKQNLFSRVRELHSYITQKNTTEMKIKLVPWGLFSRLLSAYRNISEKGTLLLNCLQFWINFERFCLKYELFSNKELGRLTVNDCCLIWVFSYKYFWGAKIKYKAPGRAW